MGRSEQISAEWLRDEIAAIYEDAAECGLTVVATNLAGAIAARLASPEPEVGLVEQVQAELYAVGLDEEPYAGVLSRACAAVAQRHAESVRADAARLCRALTGGAIGEALENMAQQIEAMPIPVADVVIPQMPPGLPNKGEQAVVADGEVWECEVVCHETNTPAVHEWYVCESCGKGRAPIPPDEADLVADGEVERAAILRNIPEDVEKSSLTDCRRSWLVKPKAAKVAGRSAFAHWVYMNLTNSSRDRRAAAKQAWNAALDQAIQICRQTNGSQCAAAHQIERLKEDR